MGARVVLSLDGEIVTEVELSKAVTVVGRHPTCDICIDHPAISGRHLLFRIVNTTIYVEDLASTNGTKVNGLSTSHQVVHHLDLIEVGKHKLHFFDDAMLAGGVANIESTVQTDFERTMLAAHVPAPNAPAKAQAAEVDLSRTMAIPRESLRQGPTARGGAAPGMPRRPRPAGGMALRVHVGRARGRDHRPRAGQHDAGHGGLRYGARCAARSAFHLARFSGTRPPRLNRQELGPGTHRLAPGDVIEVGGSTFEVMNAVR